MALTAPAVDAADPLVAVYSKDGRYYTSDGRPTFNVGEDGTVDWPTYSGFRRYASDCLVCHGPEGTGSEFGPPLTDLYKSIAYFDFIDLLTNGRRGRTGETPSVMPAYGTNPKVMCFADDIYVYLLARGSGAIDPGRPSRKEDKNPEIEADERACLGATD